MSAPSTSFSRIGIAGALVAVVTLLGALAAGVRLGDVGPQVGHPAPAIDLRTFDGQTIDLADLRGKVVLVNFWASWCVECADEAAALERLWQERRDRGLVVLGIGYTDTEPAARAYLKRFDITYPNGPDLGARISRSYGLTGVPETVLIDQQGQVVGLPIGATGSAAKLVGPLSDTGALSMADLRAVIDRLLAGGAGS